MKTVVMKFGGAAVAEPECFSSIADIVVTRVAGYDRVVIVVSAMGDMTDRLLDLAKKVHTNPPRREVDMLVSVGERISISLLAMALAAKKQKALSFTGSQSGIITCDRHTDAKIVDVRPYRLTAALDAGKVVIVAGFQGVSEKKEITTLGRGGSDTTAVALGVALQADRVEFFKDVAGIFDDDPKNNPLASHLSALTYGEALDVVGKGSGVLHPRCIELAQANAIPLTVRSFLESPDGDATIIEEPRGRCPRQPTYEDSL